MGTPRNPSHVEGLYEENQRLRALLDRDGEIIRELRHRLDSERGVEVNRAACDLIGVFAVGKLNAEGFEIVRRYR